MSTVQLRPDLVRRLVWESEAVRARFGKDLRLRIDVHGRPCWQGAVRVDGQAFPVVVTYPDAYPAEPPRLETTLPLPANCPHVLGRRPGRAALCWMTPRPRSARQRWDPQRHTAATVLRAAQRWGLALLVWQTLGVWPVADALEMPWRAATIRAPRCSPATPSSRWLMQAWPCSAAAASGALAAWSCAAAGVGTLHLADRDRMEPANSRRHVCGIADRGRAKTAALADFLRQRPTALALTAVDACFLADPATVDAILARSEIALAAVDAEGPRHLLDALARERCRPVVYAGVYGGGWGAEVIFSDASQDTPCYGCAARTLGHGGIELGAPAEPAYALPAIPQATDWVTADLTSILPCAALAARVALAWLMRSRGFERPWRELTAGGATAWRLALRQVPAWGIGPWTLQPLVVPRLPGCPVCGTGRRELPATDLFAEDPS